MTTLHTLTNAPGARRPKMRVGCGRGCGKGKTCGRGHKGQYARSGHKHKPGFEGGQMRLLRRIPKRGFNRPLKRVFQTVAVGRLEGFAAGAEITPAVLEAAGLAVRGRGAIKLLGAGDVTKSLRVKALACSDGARRKLEAAGGTVEPVA